MYFYSFSLYQFFQADSLLSLLKSSQSLDVCPLYILEDLISHSSPEQLRECCSRWVEYLSGQMQVNAYIDSSFMFSIHCCNCVCLSTESWRSGVSEECLQMLLLPPRSLSLHAKRDVRFHLSTFTWHYVVSVVVHSSGSLLAVCCHTTCD